MVPFISLFTFSILAICSRHRYGILLIAFCSNFTIATFGLRHGATFGSKRYMTGDNTMIPSYILLPILSRSYSKPLTSSQTPQNVYKQISFNPPFFSLSNVLKTCEKTSKKQSSQKFKALQGSFSSESPFQQYVFSPNHFRCHYDNGKFTSTNAIHVKNAETLVATPVSSQGFAVDAMQRHSTTNEKKAKDKTLPSRVCSDSSNPQFNRNPKKLGDRKSSTIFVSQSVLPTHAGSLVVRAYKYCNAEKTFDILALMREGPILTDNVMIRLHDQCITSEVFGSMRCDCKEQLDRSLQYAFNNQSILIYMQQEGRGIGLANKIAAYSLQDCGLDTVEANHKLGFKDDTRSYEAIPFILQDLGIKSIRLITNNPYKIAAVSQLGVVINGRIPIVVNVNEWNMRYLRSKQEKMAHVMDLQTEYDSSVASNSLLTNHQTEDILSTSFLERVSSKNRWQMGEESVVQALQAFKKGDIVMIVDDVGRENEGDLLMAAKFATPDKIAFMVEHTSGVLCTPMEKRRLEDLQIPNMITTNEDSRKTAFTVSIDAADGSTGISAASRAKTIRLLADSLCLPENLQRPGHVFPLMAQNHGVYIRQGHTEAAVDFCKLTDIEPAVAVIGEKVSRRAPTEMAKLPEIKEWCAFHGIPLTTIEDLICYRLAREFNLVCKGTK